MNPTIKTTIIFLILLSSNLFSQTKIGDTHIGELHTHDTLTYKRVFLSTRIYQSGAWLSHKKVKALYKETWQPRIKYNWSYYMKPIAPIVAIGGVYLVYDGIKGVPATAVIDGKTYDYTIRSLPKVLGGLATFALGISMIESSNELAQHSVDIYNAKLAHKKTAYIEKIKFGFTPSTQIGFTFSIK